MIDLDMTLMLLIAGIFLLLLWVLNVILFRPITQHLDGREKTISDGLSNVNQNSQEIKDLEAEAEEIIHKAKQEAAAYRDAEVNKAREAVEKKLDAKRGDNAHELQSFFKDLEEERVSLKNSLLGQAPLYKESLKAKLVSITSEG